MSESLVQIFRSLDIKFDEITHPAVFTCEEANRYLADVPGVRTKNLFLTTKTKNQYFLITTTEEGKVNLKDLAGVLGYGKLSFADASELKNLLGILPGSVSLLAIINDKDNKVKIYIDQEIWDGTLIHCHPLINSKTWLICPKELEKIFEYTGHSLNLISVPKSAL